jgi:uroporphyrinogen-III synthase
MSVNLHGLGVLITRPAGQAQRLARNIKEAGGAPLLFPTIAIVDVENPQAALATLSSLQHFDWAIFISANAVEKTFALMAGATWPIHLPAAAIGTATAEALQNHGVNHISSPKDTFDSEALLALPEFQSIKNARIAIFRGQGGRETLKQTLTERGAEVVYCETYRRSKPDAPSTHLLTWLAQKKIHAIDVMSGESLTNLLELAGDTAISLRSIPLIAHHPRVAKIATDAGFARVVTAPPGEAALITVLESLTLGKL